jgi:TonB-linked SusC/RagA family outer membrane protein
MKRTFLWLFGLLMTVQVMAQNRTITGVVTDASNGEALIGVSVSGKGTSIGTVTDFDGVYSLSVPKDVTTLVFSYVGYTSVERPVTALKMDVKMASEATQIDEVVVSAYGLNRNKGEISYQNSKVTSDELNTSGSQGALSALQGKVAGVKISKSGGNVNSSTRVVIRGESSFSGNNNALVVVDGVIVNNSSFSGGDGNGGSNVDYGNRGNDINPDDIESINVLTGPSATTLYGSAGNGGVLIITTKSGKAAAAAGKKFKVGYNTSFTVESPYILMQRQNEFGQGLWKNGGGTVDLGENFSWGPKFDGVVRPWTSPINLNGETVQLERPYSAIDNQLESFFDLGKTWSNNLSFEGGNEKFTYYAGFNYVDNKGIVPHSWFKRYGFTVNTTANLSDKLTMESSVKYVRTNQRGSVEGSSFSTNSAYFTALQTPAGIPFNEIRDYNNPFHDFNGYYGSYTVNPYYLLDNTYNLNDADNLMGSIALKYRPVKGLEITSRIANNFVIGNTYESTPVYAYSDHQVLQDIGGGILVYGDRPRENNSNIGEYTESFAKSNTLDFNNIAAYTKDWEKFRLGVTGGINITDFSNKTVGGTTLGGLITPGFYNLSNSVEIAKASNTFGQTRNIRTFGMIDLGIWKALNVNYSFANEWSSTLPEGSRGFFYNSGGVSFVASDLFKNPNKWVNYVKIRGGVGTQGNGATRYALNSVFVASPDFTPTGSYPIQFPFGGVAGFSTGNVIGNPTLTPEKITFLRRWCRC